MFLTNNPNSYWNCSLRPKISFVLSKSLSNNHNICFLNIKLKLYIFSILSTSFSWRNRSRAERAEDLPIFLSLFVITPKRYELSAMRIKVTAAVCTDFFLISYFFSSDQWSILRKVTWLVTLKGWDATRNWSKNSENVKDLRNRKITKLEKHYLLISKNRKNWLKINLAEKLQTRC